MGMDGFGLGDEKLRELYQNMPGPVAFIDESIREPNNPFDERPFYAMSGVIVDREQGSIVRDVLMDIPGSRWWHTTDAYKTPTGQRLIRQMIGYIGEAVEYNIITVQADIRRDDHSMEHARQECLTALAAELTRGTGPNAVRLLVLEQRKKEYYPGGDQRDTATIRALRHTGVIDRGVTAYHASPTYEPLLWAPDLAGWAFRRRAGVDDRTWFSPLEDITTVLRVDGADLAVKRSNPHLPQQSPGAQPTVRLNRDQGPVVASRPTIHGGKEGDYLAAIRRAPAPETGRTEREVALAVGTDDPARFAAAASEYLRSTGRRSPSAESAIAQAADHILGTDNAKKVHDALERLRAARELDDEGPGYGAPSQGRGRGIGR